MDRGSLLSGKLALVTGGSRGIGRGIAVRLAERGAAVAVNFVRDESAARQTLEAVQQVGAKGFIIRADVSRPEDVSAMAGRVREEWGQLDIFVNNALGNLLGFLRPPHVVSLEQWDEAYACQMRAFFVGVRELSPLIREGGRIVAISYSPGSHLGGFQPYFAMGTNKAALEAMCRYYAVALAPRGITVNAICGGLTDAASSISFQRKRRTPYSDGCEAGGIRWVVQELQRTSAGPSPRSAPLMRVGSLAKPSWRTVAHH